MMMRRRIISNRKNLKLKINGRELSLKTEKDRKHVIVYGIGIIRPVSFDTFDHKCGLPEFVVYGGHCVGCELQEKREKILDDVVELLIKKKIIELF